MFNTEKLGIGLNTKKLGIGLNTKKLGIALGMRLRFPTLKVAIRQSLKAGKNAICYHEVLCMCQLRYRRTSSKPAVMRSYLDVVWRWIALIAHTKVYAS